jgi:hypothetical protein
MTDPMCHGCNERDARIAELEARIADLDPRWMASYKRRLA